MSTSTESQSPTALVSISRQGRPFGLLRKLHVSVAGRQKKLAHGNEIEFEVPAGTHVVAVKMDWCGTRELFTFAAGEECEIAVEATPFASFKTFFAPGRVFSLRRNPRGL